MNDPNLVERIAEQMAVYYNLLAEDLKRAAAQEIVTFEISEGRKPHGYADIRRWRREGLGAPASPA
jgi:hypothetical protein